MGARIDMDVKVGDIVGIEITVSSYDGRRVSGKGNGGGGGRRSSIRFGRVYWAGQQAGSPMDEAHCPSCWNLMTEQQRRLQHLRQLANDALDAADAAGIEDAVNWGDLSCVEAALGQTDEGRRYYRVMIEEASPDAYKLAVYVRDWLAKRGWTDVEVLTEW